MRAALAAPQSLAEPSAEALLEALGGSANVEAVEPRSSRLCIRITNGEALDEDRLRGLGFRGFARASPNSVHLITGPDAAAWGGRLEALLAGI